MAAEIHHQHPAIEAIIAYLDAPAAAEQAALRRHLLGCPACRREVATATLLREQAPWIEAAESAPDPRLAALLDGRLDTDAAAALQAELAADPVKRRTALHFTSHALAMRDLRASGAPRAPAFAARLGARLADWWRAEVPLWQSAGAVAATLLVAVLLAPALLTDNNEWQVITFAQPGELQFVGREVQPGIGFFSTGGARLPFGGVEIEIRDARSLSLRWPAIDGANGYNLRLKVFRDGAAREITRQYVSANQAELTVGELLPRHRYEWELSGETQQRGAFIASGEFIINRELPAP